MYRIGEFSKIGRVTIETLRHYDAVGLLKPAKVDPVTGYRYYLGNQLEVLNRIIALKEVGFSLDEITKVLSEDLSDDELRGMLKAQLLMVERTISEAQMRKERILNAMVYLTGDETMQPFAIALKSVGALTVAAIRKTVPDINDVPQYWEDMFNKIGSWMVSSGITIGTPMSIYHNEGYATESIDTECAFILPESALNKLPVPKNPILIRQLEAVPLMATTVFTGNFKDKNYTLRPAYNAIVRWIDDHGYLISGAPRELYHGSPDKGELTAEIQFPIIKADKDQTLKTTAGNYGPDNN